MGTVSELSYLQALLEEFGTDQGRDLQPSSQLELTTYFCNDFIAVCRVRLQVIDEHWFLSSQHCALWIWYSVSHMVRVSKNLLSRKKMDVKTLLGPWSHLWKFPDGHLVRMMTALCVILATLCINVTPWKMGDSICQLPALYLSLSHHSSSQSVICTV